MNTTHYATYIHGWVWDGGKKGKSGDIAWNWVYDGIMNINLNPSTGRKKNKEKEEVAQKNQGANDEKRIETYGLWCDKML